MSTDEKLVHEADAPPNGKIAAFVAITVVGLVALIVGASETYNKFVADEIHQTLSQPNAALRKLQTEEKSKLSQYQWVNKNDGVVRIPTDRALELILKEAQPTPSEQGK